MVFSFTPAAVATAPVQQLPHHGLSENAAIVNNVSAASTTANGCRDEMDAQAEGMLQESQAILRQKFEDFEKEKSEMTQKMQQQASSILHFQAYCQSLVKHHSLVTIEAYLFIRNIFVFLYLDIKAGGFRGKVS